MKINHIITEFVTPQATAQDPGLEREKDVDVIIFGRMPQDFTFLEVVQALEAVLPREYPPQPPSERGMPSSPAELKGSEIAENNGAVVTTKPLSIAQKVVKEFQARGIKCRIDAPGLEEAVEDYLDGIRRRPYDFLADMDLNIYDYVDKESLLEDLINGVDWGEALGSYDGEYGLIDVGGEEFVVMRID
jgi:hypothetical protein